MLNKELIGNLSPGDEVCFENDFIEKVFITRETLEAYAEKIVGSCDEEDTCGMGCCGYEVSYYLTSDGIYESVQGYGQHTTDYTIRIACVKGE